ncbi:MAG: ABC transporter substrate-binding protein [Vicinamibacterales bacterium]
MTLLALAGLLALGLPACAPRPDVLTFSGSVVGGEGEIVRRQIARFQAAHPGVRVEVRVTPDSADTRHQLYVQWLSAWAPDPDVLQLDVIWTPEFAAAGWILPIDLPPEAAADFFPATLAANRWRGRLYAVPWFVDVGMLYWRTDLMPAAPGTFTELDAAARGAIDRGVPYGLVWQGARYEGLVTVFVEYLAGTGGRILDDDGTVVVDAPAAVRALAIMCDEVRDGIVPGAALAWQEEQTRFAFQNGRAAMMRNWPYAAALMRDPSGSAVAGRFGVAPMPHGAGTSGAALGGAQLAVNARSRQPDLARELVRFLTAPAQMLERAEIAGQFPARRRVYDEARLAAALPIAPADARRIIEHAVPRPATPLYTQLSGLLQIQLHRALTGQASPAEALSAAADGMRRAIADAGLDEAAR